MACLVAHDWPGNVRELENVLASAMILCQDGASIEPEHFRST
jgi:transcriptional regulator of acetoin/glycerol metabolism